MAKPLSLSCAAANPISRLNRRIPSRSTASSPGAANPSTWSSTTSTVIRTSWTTCCRLTDRAISWGAAANTSPVSRGASPGVRSHSTNEAMPACATSITHDRWSAGIDRNHGNSSSIRAVLLFARLPAARSSRRNVDGSSGFSVTPAACHGPPPDRAVTRTWAGLAWAGLAWAGLAWAGLGWPGLAWQGSRSLLSVDLADVFITVCFTRL